MRLTELLRVAFTAIPGRALYVRGDSRFRSVCFIRFEKASDFRPGTLLDVMPQLVFRVASTWPNVASNRIVWKRIAVAAK